MDETGDLQGRVQVGVQAGELLDYATHAFLGPREVEIRKRIFAMIDSDQALSPALAIQSWLQLYEAHAITKRLRKLRKDGIAAGEKLEKSLHQPH